MIKLDIGNIIIVYFTFLSIINMHLIQFCVVKEDIISCNDMFTIRYPHAFIHFTK